MSRKRTPFGSKRKAKITRALIERDGRDCWLCGEPIPEDAPPLGRLSITIDHVIPISAGGVNAQTNLRLAHRKCNMARGNSLTHDQHQAIKGHDQP